jgi:hypothetical protein
MSSCLVRGRKGANMFCHRRKGLGVKKVHGNFIGKNMKRKGSVALGEEEKESTCFVSLVTSTTLCCNIFVALSFRTCDWEKTF